MALTLSSQENLSPWDALLLAVNRRAARVRYCDAIAEHLIDEHRKKAMDDPELDGNVPPKEARDWLAESRNEERLMTRAAKMAVDAGVADAMIRRIEREGKMMMEAMIAGLDALPLSPDQRLAALSAMHSQLALSGPQTQPAIEGKIVDDDDSH